MRIIKIKNQQGVKREIKISPLTRSKIKKMDNYNYLGPANLTVESVDEAVDEMLEAILSADDLSFIDNCSLKDMKKIWDECIKENYGDRGEEKNLPTTSPGGQTKKE